MTNRLATLISFFVVFCWSSVAQSQAPITGKIVYRTRQAGEPVEIYIMDANGSDPGVRLTNTSNVEWSPQLSPDGTKVLFNRGIGAVGKLYIINLDGINDEYKLTPFDNNFGPERIASWSPAGDKIAFSDNANQLWVINADGTDEKVVASISYRR